MTSPEHADIDVQHISERIKRATVHVVNDIAKDRRMYARVVRTADKEMIGYERDLIIDPLTEPEARMLLASSLSNAAESILHILYQGKHGLDLRRMRALINIVERAGRHEFARQKELHAALRNSHWRVAANLIIELLVRRGVSVKIATDLADQIRQGAKDLDQE